MKIFASRSRNKIKEGNTAVTVMLYITVAIIGFVTLYPMYYVLILSLSDPAVAATMRVYTVPQGFTLEAFRVIVVDSAMWRAYANTIFYAATTTVLMLITSVLGAFFLTYKNLVGRKYITIFLLIPMFFSGGMIPSFLLIVRLGLLNSPWSQIIPASFSIWNIILVKAFFSSIPESMREAAKMDGANVYQILMYVYVPMSQAILAVLAVFTIVAVWNSWFAALLYLHRLDWQPLQLYLRRVLVEQTVNLMHIMDPDAARELALRQMSNAQLRYAMIIFTTLPVLLTYPFFQKYFVKGVMLGSLKE